MMTKRDLHWTSVDLHFNTSGRCARDLVVGWWWNPRVYFVADYATPTDLVVAFTRFAYAILPRHFVPPGRGDVFSICPWELCDSNRL